MERKNVLGCVATIKIKLKLLVQRGRVALENITFINALLYICETVGKQETTIPLLIDKAYEDDYTQLVAQMLKFDPIVPPKSNRLRPWDYDKTLYKLRNKIERLFRLIQEFLRVFCRFENSTSCILVYSICSCLCGYQIVATRPSVTTSPA